MRALRAVKIWVQWLNRRLSPCWLKKRRPKPHRPSKLLLKLSLKRPLPTMQPRRTRHRRPTPEARAGFRARRPSFVIAGQGAQWARSARISNL
jgi:hypothetical protein